MGCYGEQKKAMTGRAEDTEVLWACLACGGAGGGRLFREGEAKKRHLTLMARLLIGGMCLAQRQVCFPLGSYVF